MLGEGEGTRAGEGGGGNVSCVFKFAFQVHFLNTIKQTEAEKTERQSKETKAEPRATGRGPGPCWSRPLRKWSWAPGLPGTKRAASFLAAGSGRAHSEHVQQRPAVPAWRRRVARGLGCCLAHPAGPPPSAGSLNPPLGEKGSTVWKTELDNLIKSWLHHAHRERGSWNSFCVHRLTLLLWKICANVFRPQFRAPCARQAATAVIHY